MSDTLERVSTAYNVADEYDLDDPAEKQAFRDEFLDDFIDFREGLETGEFRAAERNEDGDWEAVPEVKQGILAAFSLGQNEPVDGSYMQFQDKDTLPPQEELDDARIVPGGTAIRKGAHIDEEDVIVMPPAYVNVGAHVENGTLVDSFALVGSAAQVGEDVHLSTGAKLGGVLEPVGESPVVIENGAYIGGNAGVYDGTVVREGAALAAGVQIASGTEIYDTVEDDVYAGEVPANAVVIPGAVEYDEAGDVTTYKQAAIIPKYGDESTDAETKLEEMLR